MSSFVADASAVAPWILRDEEHEASEALYARALQFGVHAPTLFHYEINNLVLIAMRRGRIDPAGVRQAQSLVRHLPISLWDVGTDESIFDLARSHALTVYDASYLHVALAQGLPLATYDKALHRAAAAAGVAIVT